MKKIFLLLTFFLYLSVSAQKITPIPGYLRCGNHVSINNTVFPAWLHVNGKASADTLLSLRNSKTGSDTGIFVLSNGNIGIGTNSPVYRLQVRSADNIPLHISSSSSYGEVQLVVGTNTSIIQSSTNGTFFGARSNDNVSFLLNAQTKLRITTTGALMFGSNFSTGGSSSANVLAVEGSLSIGTISSSYALSLGGNASRIIGLERHTTAGTAGNSLTLLSGGAYSGGTDLAGGSLILSSGTATGTGYSDIYFKTVSNGSTGSTDRSAANKVQILSRLLIDNSQAGTDYDAGSYIDISPGTAGGMLQLVFGDAEEYVWAMFSSDAIVTLITYSSDVVSSNTDAKICIEDNGSAVRISNALGASKIMTGQIIYNQ